MNNPNQPGDAKRYTVTIFISFVVLLLFSLLMMQWTGPFEKRADGKLHYDTKVIEPTSGY